MGADLVPDRDPAEAAEAAPAPKTVRAPGGDVKELRLGLVCYGGVSLAIYMHGMTKEIHRAIRASVLEERDLPSRKEAASELAYRRLLAALRAERDVHTRIVVDTVAGSSAGGINGIFLAKALAHDLTQDGLRDLWFEHGDLEKIIRKPEGLRGRLAATLAKAVPASDGDVPSEEAREKLLVAALGVYAEPLLEGDEMTRRIYEALSGMQPDEDARAAGLASLMPRRHPLELAVTVTDHYGYARELPIADPPVVAEGQHRHLLQFRYRSDHDDDFGKRENAALALAARATSSLPVGFQPVHVGSFANVLPQGATTEDDLRRFFRTYELAGAEPGWARLLDGGILDNKPFGPVLRAMKRRHAANEVDRYLIFLEPDPKSIEPPKDEPRTPTPIPALLGALSGLPRAEPILDELHDLLVRNERVRAVRDAIEANWTPIERRVLDLVDDLRDPPADPADPKLREWSKKIDEAAKSLGELAYPMYVRLKISSALDTFAGAASLVCDYTDDSNQAFLVRAVVREWARKQRLFQHEDSPTPKQLQFVDDFDLEYGQRRLHFVIAGVSWLYRDLGTEGHPSRQELDAVKERLYEGVAKLEWLASGRGFAGEVLGGVQACFGEERLREHLKRHRFDTSAFLASHGAELDALNEALRAFLVAGRRTFTPDLYRDLIRLTESWTRTETAGKIRRDLLVRYLGFPIWDSLLYPLQALSELDERDAVRVARMSPMDSTLLTPLSPEGKVLGAGLGHAYAFFDRKARENDYLWGRLDAAERMVRLLLTKTIVQDGRGTIVPGSEHRDYRARCKEVFQAVLAEDADDLETMRDDIAALRRQIEEL